MPIRKRDRGYLPRAQHQVPRAGLASHCSNGPFKKVNPGCTMGERQRTSQANGRHGPRRLPKSHDHGTPCLARVERRDFDLVALYVEKALSDVPGTRTSSEARADETPNGGPQFHRAEPYRPGGPPVPSADDKGELVAL